MVGITAEGVVVNVESTILPLGVYCAIGVGLELVYSQTYFSITPATNKGKTPYKLISSAS